MYQIVGSGWGGMVPSGLVPAGHGLLVPAGQPGMMALQGQPGMMVPQGQPGMMVPAGQPGMMVPQGQQGMMAQAIMPGLAGAGQQAQAAPHSDQRMPRSDIEHTKNIISLCSATDGAMVGGRVPEAPAYICKKTIP